MDTEYPSLTHRKARSDWARGWAVQLQLWWRSDLVSLENPWQHTTSEKQGFQPSKGFADQTAWDLNCCEPFSQDQLVWVIFTKFIHESVPGLQLIFSTPPTAVTQRQPLSIVLLRAQPRVAVRDLGKPWPKKFQCIIRFPKEKGMHFDDTSIWINPHIVNSWQ